MDILFEYLNISNKNSRLRLLTFNLEIIKINCNIYSI